MLKPSQYSLVILSEKSNRWEAVENYIVGKSIGDINEVLLKEAKKLFQRHCKILFLTAYPRPSVIQEVDYLILTGKWILYDDS